MDDFPRFMKNPANAIDPGAQSKGAAGYIFEGADGSQMAHWTCLADGTSDEHVHDFDEYFTVVQGLYTLIIGGRKIPVSAGQEFFIEKGTPHSGEFTAGTRTIHAFGGRRVERPGGG